jgi:hypothetical protein
VFALAGWFVGALIAELRVARLTSRRSAAVLVPRTADRYLPPVALWATPAAAGVCVALTLVLSLGASAGGQAAFLLVAALTVTAAVWAAQRHVLTRAQPVTAPDVTEADNAIRSRSLHALSGSGTALALYCALGLANVTAVAWADLSGVVAAANVIGALAVPLLGWRMATSPWPVAGLQNMSTASTLPCRR